MLKRWIRNLKRHIIQPLKNLEFVGPTYSFLGCTYILRTWMNYDRFETTLFSCVFWREKGIEENMIERLCNVWQGKSLARLDWPDAACFTSSLGFIRLLFIIRSSSNHTRTHLWMYVCTLDRNQVWTRSQIQKPDTIQQLKYLEFH